MTNEDDEMIELNQKVYEEAGEHNERIKEIKEKRRYRILGKRIRTG